MIREKPNLQMLFSMVVGAGGLGSGGVGQGHHGGSFMAVPILPVLPQSGDDVVFDVVLVR